MLAVQLLNLEKSDASNESFRSLNSEAKERKKYLKQLKFNNKLLER